MTNQRKGPGKVRLLDWTLRDEVGNDWDRQPGWLAASEVGPAVARASRVLVHDEAVREVRESGADELAELVRQVSADGRSGDVVAAEYPRRDETLVLLRGLC